MRYYARTLEGRDESSWQPLEDHLRSVSNLAAGFASSFDSSEWAALAGLWHDLGKYDPDFQAKLRGSRTRVEHSGVGAALAVVKGHPQGLPLAFAIAGHHAGMANYRESGIVRALEERVAGNKEMLTAILPDVPDEIKDPSLPSELPEFFRAPEDKGRTRLEFWTRMLFSALIDADRLDAEAFTLPQGVTLRTGFSTIPELRRAIDQYVDDLVASLPIADRKHTLQRVRSKILADCREAPGLPPGNFSLSVPTGTGKTLSAMTFALRHAERHELRRVIVVIPYTSIIEQNAAVYRDALGAENVLEHHSNVDQEQRSSSLGETVANRLDFAAENWDAPVIVTTTVQFFESLLSNRPSACRKLHNIARSVVVFDEVQALPPGLLAPILDVLGHLTADYDCSVVLSTATPPALAERDKFEGLKNVRAIASFERDEPLRERVRYHWPSTESGPIAWSELAYRLSEHEQVLAVVHRRNDARTLAEALLEVRGDDVSTFHLSALMCPAHRSDVLSNIRCRLEDGVACRVVSTQLIEAGVDIDFPVVYRALAGLDSIVQAAGRCNREGRLDQGKVFVFVAPSEPPGETLRKGLDVTRTMLRAKGGTIDLSDSALMEEYFRRLFAIVESFDTKRIQPQRKEFKFANVARDFKIIEDGFTTSVVVPYGRMRATIAAMHAGLPRRHRIRRLQPYTVGVYPRAFEKLLAMGAIEDTEGLNLLAERFETLYSDRFGLRVGDETFFDPEAHIC